MKALNGTTWGKQKPTLIATYKATVRPIIEYGSTIWSPIIKETNLNKLQVTQNTALRIATGCTSDTHIQHLHAETKVLPLANHQKLQQTNVANLIKKFVANYIKGRKGYTLYQGAQSKQQQFKTGVRQGGVLSPTLFNLYTSDLPAPPQNVSITPLTQMT